MTAVSEQACPTQGGIYSAWQPEWESGDLKILRDGWIAVPYGRGERGIPDASAMRGINLTMDLCSTYSQAMALAWAFAAHREAETGVMPAVRVVEYRVEYDIKCYRAAAAISNSL